MTTTTVLLLIWSALCAGLPLASVSWKGRRTGEVLGETIGMLGVGLMFWSVGIGVWMVVGFVWRALG